MIAMNLTNFFTVEIKQIDETNMELVKTIESALLLSLLDKQFIHQQQFEHCIRRIRGQKYRENEQPNNELFH